MTSAKVTPLSVKTIKEKKSVSLGSKLMSGCCGQNGIEAGRGIHRKSLNLQLSIILAPDRIGIVFGPGRVAARLTSPLLQISLWCSLNFKTQNLSSAHQQSFRLFQFLWDPVLPSLGTLAEPGLSSRIQSLYRHHFG